MTAIVNGAADPNRCFWRFPEQCESLAQWQVTARHGQTARVCHGHLTETCQTWAMAAPLTVEPIFLNWDKGAID